MSTINITFFNLLLLSIILPTLVTISDMFVAYQMFSASEVVWFLTILTPIILNFLFTVLVWWKMEKAGTKRWSWLFLLILAWPQWKAANLVRLISWKGNRVVDGNPNKRVILQTSNCLN